MDFSQLLDLGFLAELLSDSGKASLTEKLFIVGAVWLLMGKKVTSHFKALEDGMKSGFAQLTHSVDEVRRALTEVEQSHSNKIDSLIAQQNHLSKRVETLEDFLINPEEP